MGENASGGGIMEAENRPRAAGTRKRRGGRASSSVMLAGFVSILTVTPPTRASQSLPSSPVDFEASGIADSPVKYSARTASYSLFLSNQEADVVLHGEETPGTELSRGKMVVVKAYATVVRMRFVGSNLSTAVSAMDASDRSRPPFAVAAYRGIYPGTDLLLRAQRRRIVFQVNLSAGADRENIVLELVGATEMKLDDAGNAVVSAGRGSFELEKPVIETNGSGKLAPGAYKIERGNRLRFIVPDRSSANDQAIGD